MVSFVRYAAHTDLGLLQDRQSILLCRIVHLVCHSASVVYEAERYHPSGRCEHTGIPFIFFFLPLLSPPNSTGGPFTGVPFQPLSSPHSSQELLYLFLSRTPATKPIVIVVLVET